MNIYISNLSYGVRNAGLQDLFAAYGEVSSARVITDKQTGRSKGFGFVEMVDEQEGQKAIDALNETMFEGRTIKVTIAKPRD